MVGASSSISGQVENIQLTLPFPAHFFAAGPKNELKSWNFLYLVSKRFAISYKTVVAFIFD